MDRLRLAVPSLSNGVRKPHGRTEMDRGYAKCELLYRIVCAGSSYVRRDRDNNFVTVLDEKPLADLDGASRREVVRYPTVV